MNVRLGSLGRRELSRKKQTRGNEKMEDVQREHKAFNLLIEQLIAALDGLAANKVD